MDTFVLRSFLLATAAAAFGSCGSVPSQSQFANEYVSAGIPVVISALRVDALPSSANPSDVSIQISGKVQLGDSPCTAADASAELVATKAGSNIDVVAMLKISGDAINRNCTREYDPVYTHVSIMIEAKPSEIGEIFVHNVEEMGRSARVFRGESLSLKAGIFKLYGEPRHQADPECDIHTKLKLQNVGQRLHANMSEGLDGSCRILIEPKERLYKSLSTEDIGCGSFKYQAWRKFPRRMVPALSDPVKIEIVDHRGRICRDLVPAKIITTETLANGKQTVKYSN